MSWSSTYRYPFLVRQDRRLPPHPFGVNEQCFIRKEHECGKIYGASKSCFIACPTDDDLEPILELMSEKLTKVGVEPIIAVKERAYGQDIFCTKICGKIIESRFCVVILDDTVSDTVNIPNPNVYYEYGVMTSLRKHIIPLQRENLDLAFNIQSYDTIKYTSRNIASELDRTIRDALRLTETQESEVKRPSISDRTILRRLELAGFQVKGDNWFLWRAIEDTQLKGFGHSDKGSYLYLGKVDDPSEFQDYLEDVDVAIYRTEKKAEELKNQIQALAARLEDFAASSQLSLSDVSGPQRGTHTPDSLTEREARRIEVETADKKHLLDKMTTIFIAFIVAPQINSTEFVKQAEELAGQSNRYKVARSTDNELWIDDICVNLKTQGG